MSSGAKEDCTVDENVWTEGAAVQAQGAINDEDGRTEGAAVEAQGAINQIKIKYF